jgi:hypothetical protein
VTITVFDGTGILSGVHDWDEIDRQIKEDRRHRELVAAREARQQDTASGIEKAVTPYLRAELAEEIAARKLSAETMRKYRADFLRFKECCAKWDLPHLPASPQAVAGFLSSECSRGLTHVNRLVKAISVAHCSADLSDPTTDILVKAVVRLVKKDPYPTAKPSN